MKIDKTKVMKSITVYVPGNVCNLRCSYCYITEIFEGQHAEKAVFHYTVEHMVKAFEPIRLGGIAEFTVIGAGETLIPEEVVPFVKGLLHQGHVVTVVTNAVLENRIDELLDMPQEDLERLIIKCSLHWNELKRLKLEKVYFDNIRRVLSAGASAYPSLVICQEYMPYLDEICDRCKKELGAPPVCTPCVTAKTADDFLAGKGAGTNPECSPEFVDQIDDKFHSPLFRQCVRFMNVDVRKVFCYAGAWSFGVDMGTGSIVKCHNIGTGINLFENLDKKVELTPVGCECGISSCCLQYNFFGEGLIPEIANVPTYSEMIGEGNHFLNDKAKKMLDIKFPNFYKTYTMDEQRNFLMKSIEKKNQEIKDLRRRVLEKSKYSNVEYLLQLIDDRKTSYTDLANVTYNTMFETMKVCETMPNGMEMYNKIWNIILTGLFSSHCYKSIGYIYHQNDILEREQILKLSVSVLVSETDILEKMNDNIITRNIKDLANIMCKQMMDLATDCV